MPTILLMTEEIPGLVFVVYLSVCKEREIKRYLKRQKEISDHKLKIIDDSNKCDHMRSYEMSQSDFGGDEQLFTVNMLLKGDIS